LRRETGEGDGRRQKGKGEGERRRDMFVLNTRSGHYVICTDILVRTEGHIYGSVFSHGMCKRISRFPGFRGGCRLTFLSANTVKLPLAMQGSMRYER
jgi:hypothetical protein